MHGKDDFEQLVTIIIPVYNAEKYLHACMDSMIRQSMEGIQVICIDDGSTDHSLQILEAYAQKDRRITVLQEMHKGAASARNTGMKYARGQYICFLDSDDIFEPDLMEELYTSATGYQAEIAICEYDTNIDGTATDFMDLVGKRYMGNYAKKTFRIQELPVDAFLIWNTAPWTKLYRLDFLKKNKLQFQQLASANDLYFTVMSLICADRIIHTSSYRALVHYRINRKEQISGRRKAMDVYLAWKKIYEQIQNADLDQRVYSQFYAAVLLGLIYELSGKSESDTEKKAFYDFFSQKGMKEIGLEMNVFDNLPEPYRELPECFSGKTFESGWFLQKKRICIQLEQKNLQELKKLCLENRVVLWGVGANGLPVLQMFAREKIRLAGVVDNETGKRGQKICGYVIHTYAELQDGLDMIMITSKRAFNSICSEIVANQKRDVRIIPLFMWLETEMELEDCILDFKRQ